MIKRLFFLILLVAGLSFTFADETPDLRELPKTEASSEVENVYYLVELDSVDIYKELIAQEDKESSCVMDVVSIVVGSGITGVGAGLLGIGLYAMFDSSNQQSFDGAFNRVGGFFVILASVPVLLLGIPVIVNSVGDYKMHKEHAIKRDKYQEAFDRYKVRMLQEGWQSVQLRVVPTLNLANASFGANAILSF